MTAKKRERKETEWVVIERVEAVTWRPAGSKDEPRADAAEAWMVIGQHTSTSRSEAYDAIVGEKTGRFKAISKASWAGGRVKAQETLVTSKPLVD